VIALAHGWLLAPLLGGALLLGLCRRFGWARFLDRPIDLGRSWRGRRIFGDNKTWRGLAAFALGAAVTFRAQAAWTSAPPALELLDHGSVRAPWAVGLALGAAALLSELPNSFVKRRLGIAPGGAPRRGRALSFAVDQVDLLAGFWIVLACVSDVRAGVVAVSFALFFLAHVAATHVGRRLGMRAAG
jgi:hypothetical protein